MRPWTNYRISECKEALISLPSNFLRLEPHPYVSLGAPYGEGLDPWLLREEVVSRLFLAQKYLQLENDQLCLLIFDAWRPIAVQEFMVNHVINQECLLRGIIPNDDTDSLIKNNIVDEVSRFWANPSMNPSTPPPHSTGGAIDLTLANLDGTSLDMGGEIDEISEISKPNYYAQDTDDQSYGFRINLRRLLLANVMKQAGFIQHPNEWWHFSFGDQMWAWATNADQAIYGAWTSRSKSFTA